MQARTIIPKKVFKDDDADENGWIAVIHGIVQHHCGVASDVRDFSFALVVADSTRDE